MPFDPQFAALAALLVVLLASAGLLLVDLRRARLSRRLAEVSHLRQRRPDAVAMPSIQIAQRNPGSWTRRVLGLVAFDPSRPQEHPMAWPLVVLLAIAGGAACGLLAAAMFSRSVAVAGCLISTALIARAIFAYGSTSYREKLFVQMPDAMGMIARAMRAGIPVSEAIRAIVRESPEPTRREFLQVNAEQAIGIPLETSLFNLYQRTGLREYGFFAVTITLHQQTGGNLTETLDNLAEIVRKRVQTAARGKALTGQARTSAAILAVIPLIAFGLLALLNPRYIAFYFTHPKGGSIIAMVIVLMLMGVLTMRTMIRRSLAVT
jgi:tight adherence protein B